MGNVTQSQISSESLSIYLLLRNNKFHLSCRCSTAIMWTRRNTLTHAHWLVPTGGRNDWQVDPDPDADPDPEVTYPMSSFISSWTVLCIFRCSLAVERTDIDLLLCSRCSRCSGCRQLPWFWLNNIFNILIMCLWVCTDTSTILLFWKPPSSLSRFPISRWSIHTFRWTDSQLGKEHLWIESTTVYVFASKETTKANYSILLLKIVNPLTLFKHLISWPK